MVNAFFACGVKNYTNKGCSSGYKCKPGRSGGSGFSGKYPTVSLKPTAAQHVVYNPLVMNQKEPTPTRTPTLYLPVTRVSLPSTTHQLPINELSCANKKVGATCYLPGGDKGVCDGKGRCVYSKEKNLPPTPTVTPTPYLPLITQAPAPPCYQKKDLSACQDASGRQGYCRVGVCIVQTRVSSYVNPCKGKNEGDHCTSPTGDRGTCNAFGYCQVVSRFHYSPTPSPTTWLSQGVVVVVDTPTISVSPTLIPEQAFTPAKTPTPTLIPTPTLVPPPTLNPDLALRMSFDYVKTRVPPDRIDDINVAIKAAKKTGLEPFIVYPNSGDPVIEQLYQILASNTNCGNNGCWAMTSEDSSIVAQLAENAVIIRTDIDYAQSANYVTNTLMPHEHVHAVQARNAGNDFAEKMHCDSEECAVLQALIEAQAVKTSHDSDYYGAYIRFYDEVKEQARNDNQLLNLFEEVSWGHDEKVPDLIAKLEEQGIDVRALLDATGVTAARAMDNNQSS